MAKTITIYTEDEVARIVAEYHAKVNGISDYPCAVTFGYKIENINGRVTKVVMTAEVGKRDES